MRQTKPAKFLHQHSNCNQFQEEMSFHSTRSRTGCKEMCLGYWLLLLVLSNIPASSSTPSCCTVCDCKPHEVWCEYRGLTSVPVNIPTNTRRLYLFNNNISTIPEAVFADLKKLELIDLSSNQLSSDAIRPRVFNGLQYLQDLMLSSNKLTHIKENTFSDIPSLVRLYLEDNGIEKIDKSAFSNLNKLVELKLSNNRLSSFPKIINCPNLRRLYLSHNRLVRLQTNTLSEVDLEQLTLSSNQLNQLPSTIFRDVSNMRQLDLSKNHITRMPRIISNMNSLHTLNLSGNSISSMPDNFLSNLRRMKVLDLKGLKLTVLPKDFIPRRVYLNMFDISNNPWTCDCSIMWLTNYMRIVGGVFIGMSHVRCDSPSRLRGRQLVTLSEDDLTCDSVANQPQTPSEEPMVDVCDGLACDNGAKCHVDETTKMPACRCLLGWTGLLCNIPDGSASTLSNTNQAELLIQSNSVTTHSVEIMFPTTERLITIDTTELETERLETSSVIIFPNTHTYTVRNLKPGTRYRICVSFSGGNQNSDARKTEDKLCSSVKTKAVEAYPESKNDGDSFENEGGADLGKSSNNIYAETGQRENHINEDNEEVKGAPKESDMSLLLPVLGACLGICFASAIIALFVCYRRKQSRDNDVGERMTKLRNDKLQMTTEEVVPMVKDQCYIPTSYSCDSSTMTQTTDDMYQLPVYHQQSQRSFASHQRRATPCGNITNENMNSKYDSKAPRYCLPKQNPPNNRETQKQDFEYERQNMCPSHDVSANWGSLEQAEWLRMNNSRQECLSERNCGGYSDAPTDGSLRSSEVFRTTPTLYLHNNEMYHSPNATQHCVPEITYGHQLHNSLKISSKNRDLRTPPTTYSLRSEHRANSRNAHRETRHNHPYGSAAKQGSGPTCNERRTMVI